MCSLLLRLLLAPKLKRRRRFGHLKSFACLLASLLALLLPSFAREKKKLGRKKSVSVFIFHSHSSAIERNREKAREKANALGCTSNCNVRYGASSTHRSHCCFFFTVRAFTRPTLLLLLLVHCALTHNTENRCARSHITRAHTIKHTAHSTQHTQRTADAEQEKYTQLFCKFLKTFTFTYNTHTHTQSLKTISTSTLSLCFENSPTKP